MAKDLRWSQPPSAESVSRLVNFSDAVVAIAMTLLVLPLVDLEPPTGDQTVWEVLDENSGTLLAFALSFTITLMYWRRHHRMFDGLISFTPMLVALNGLWLGVIVFLQVPTEMLGHTNAAGASTLYLLTLTAATVAGFLLLVYLQRHPELIEPGHAVQPDQVTFLGITSAVMLLLTLASIWLPSGGLYGLLLLIPLGWAEQAWLKRRSPADAAASA